MESKMSITAFAKRFRLHLFMINAAMILFLFYASLITNPGIGTVIGLLALIGLNALFYIAFKNENIEEQKLPTDEEVEEIEKKTNEITGRREEILSKLNDRDKRLFKEFEEELRKLPLEQRTDKKADEVMARLRGKYEKNE